LGCGEYILCDGVLQNIVGWTCCSCFFLERMDQFGKTIPRGRHSPGVLKNSLWLIEEHRCVLLLIPLDSRVTELATATDCQKDYYRNPVDIISEASREYTVAVTVTPVAILVDAKPCEC